MKKGVILISVLDSEVEIGPRRRIIFDWCKSKRDFASISDRKSMRGTGTYEWKIIHGTRIGVPSDKIKKHLDNITCYSYTSMKPTYTIPITNQMCIHIALSLLTFIDKRPKTTPNLFLLDFFAPFGLYEVFFKEELVHSYKNWAHRWSICCPKWPSDYQGNNN